MLLEQLCGSIGHCGCDANLVVVVVAYSLLRLFIFDVLEICSTAAAPNAAGCGALFVTKANKSKTISTREKTFGVLFY
jgi:hypothetical protein